jgi:transcriptional regulator with XRE-family HTH domain
VTTTIGADIGRNVRRVRTKRGLSQTDVADRSSVPQPTISNIEGGKQEPHHSTLLKLARAMDVKVTEFFKEKPGPKTPPPPPPTPLTDEPESEFDARFGAPGLEAAEALAGEVGKEYDALGEYLAALDALGIGNDDLRRRSGRSRRRASKRRTLAATSRYANMVLNADFGRDLAIHNTVAAYAGQAEAVAEYVAQEARQKPGEAV